MGPQNSESTWKLLILQLFLFNLELLQPVSWQNKVKKQRFVIIDHFDHEFDYRSHLKLKSSSGALNCLNITSVSLLECSFVPKQGPWSLIIVPWSSGSWRASLWVHPWSLIIDPILDSWSLIFGPWYMSLYVAICRYMSLYVAICRYMSLYVGVCPCIGTD